MPEIRKPAVKIKQGDRSLFLTSFTVGDFTRENFYRVDRLDLQESKGMQRLLNVSRARSFSTDMQAADACASAFLPTSVFLATSGEIGYDEKTKELFFESDKQGGICPLDVVDGQHRIEGLKMASEKLIADNNVRLRDFPIPVVIADNLTETEKMLQFVVVNTKQKAVDSGVEQHIIARFTKMRELEDIPHLPAWLERKADKGEDALALEIVLYLNKEASSPWRGRIRLADNPQADSLHTVNQSSIVKSIKKHIFSRNHPLHQFDPAKRKAILKNFWIAVKEIFVGESDDDISDSAAFKYTGVEFFLSISAPVINQLAKNRSYTKQAFKDCMLSAQDYLEEAEIMSPDFWKIGSAAGSLNAAGLAKKAAAFTEALAKASNKDVEV